MLVLEYPFGTAVEQGKPCGFCGGYQCQPGKVATEQGTHLFSLPFVNDRHTVFNSVSLWDVVCHIHRILSFSINPHFSSKAAVFLSCITTRSTNCEKQSPSNSVSISPRLQKRMRSASFSVFFISPLTENTRWSCSADCDFPSACAPRLQ